MGPLVFHPIFKPKIWGGRRLQTLLAKQLPADQPIGESWELADLEDDQSVVRTGPLEGSTLGDLVKTTGKDLLGSAGLFEGRFPLLIKFLDARESLSVQVHPDAKMAARLGGRVRIKNEAWYVLHAEPGGHIYRGLSPGVTRESFRSAIGNGTVETVLNKISVKAGDCHYLPSGTVHALGAGVMVAEVQTPSDITYRVYDWNRTDANTGKPRDLHIEQAIECINFDEPEQRQPARSHVASVWTAVTQLVKCESFVIERVRMADGVQQSIPTGELIIWIVLEGNGRILCRPDHHNLTFEQGDTVLIPAALADAQIETQADCMWLEVTIPLPSDLKDYPRPDRSELNRPEDFGRVQLNIDLGKDRP